MDNKAFVYLKKYIANHKIKLKVTGISMEPIIYQDDVIVIEDKNYRENDIIAYLYNNTLLVHRIIKIKSNIIWCKGDNAVSFEKISCDNVLGVIIGVIHNKNEDERDKNEMEENV